MLDHPPSRVTDTVWLIRHLAVSARHRRCPPPQTCSVLTARRLCPQEGVELLGQLAELLPEPLAIAPPCCSLRSRHESIIVTALTALEAGDTRALLLAVQGLAAPVVMSQAEAERASAVLARLAGYDGPMRYRCSSGNGGEAMGFTASDTSATALSSPATRFDFSAPQL